MLDTGMYSAGKEDASTLEISVSGISLKKSEDSPGKPPPKKKVT